MKKREKAEFILENLGEVVLSVPKTIYLNFKVLPLRIAVKLPIFVSYHVKLKGINRKNFIVDCKNCRTASIRIGFGGSRFSAGNGKKGLIQIKNGTLKIGQNAGISQGIVIDVKNANLVLGKHFRCNYSTLISCEDDDIVMGDEVVLGWNVVVRNNDGHCITEMGKQLSNHGPISIGNHVWLCSDSKIFKGVSIGDDSAVAGGSIVTRGNYESNVLLAGVPADVVKRNINWKE